MRILDEVAITLLGYSVDHEAQNKEAACELGAASFWVVTERTGRGVDRPRCGPNRRSTM